MQKLNETIAPAPLARSHSPQNRLAPVQRPTAVEPSGSSRIVIGVDEAGYGPNIGPMLVAGTAWRVPTAIDEDAFVELLSHNFHTAAWTENCQHVPLGDSKQLYSPSSGLRSLEAGLLAMLSHVSPDIARGTLTNLLQSLDCFGPWHAGSTLSIPAWLGQLPEEMPLHVSPSEILRLSQTALNCLSGHGIELLSVRAAVILESQFNQAVAQLGSKGRLLSSVTMHVVMQLLSNHQEQAVEVFCDRQGGRKKYACVLLEAMPDEWFDTLAEQPVRSSYRRQRSPSLTFHFSVGGDSFAPTALASMTAKYLRERLMGGVNRYWQSHIANLQPTAGYPLDAKRFRSQIESTAAGLGHSVDQWWRVC